MTYGGTLSADKIVADLLEIFSDARITRSIKVIQSSCKELIFQKEIITISKVADHISKNYESKPSRKTLFNDPKGIYEKIIIAYQNCNPIKTQEKVKSTNVDSTSFDNGIPLETKIYIQQLEEHVKILQIQIDKYFKKDVKENTLDLNKILDQTPNKEGNISVDKNTPSFDKNQVLALTLLIGSDLDIGGDPIEIKGQGNNRFGVDLTTGEHVLTPTHFKSLENLLNKWSI